MRRDAFALVWVLSVGVADARPASRGWYAEGGLGAVAFLPAAAEHARPGLALNVRIGRDLLPWASLGLQLAASSHEATVPPPPEGEWFQLYRAAADLRLGGQLGAIAIFVEGGAGFASLSSNILDKVRIREPGETFSLAVHAGAGLEYQLENRHYALGVAIDAFLLPQFDGIRGLDTRAFLRYTY